MPGNRRAAVEKWSNKGLQQMIVKQMQKQKMIIGFLKRSQSTLEGAPWIAPSAEPTEPTCSDDLITTTDLVSLAQQQYQQFNDRISGLDARMATLQTHAEALHEQIRVAEIVIQQLRTNPTNPPPPSRAAFQRQATEGAFKALTYYTGNHSEYHDFVLQCETSPCKSG